MKRNEAGQHLAFQMNKLADGTNDTGLSGAIEVNVAIDGGVEAPGSGGVTETSNGGYQYLFNQPETDGYQIAISFYHPSAITQRYNIYTDDGSVSTELAKVIKDNEPVQVVQNAVNSNTDVDVTTTRK